MTIDYILINFILVGTIFTIWMISLAMRDLLSIKGFLALFFAVLLMVMFAALVFYQLFLTGWYSVFSFLYFLVVIFVLIDYMTTIKRQ